jgi:hypothetical protein
MTLWMPLLNYTQSYRALVDRLRSQLDTPGCVETMGLGQGQIAAFQFYGGLQLVAATAQPRCPWLLFEPPANTGIPPQVDTVHWTLQGTVQHPASGGESVLLYRRK